MMSKFYGNFHYNFGHEVYDKFAASMIVSA